jgi:hypothetical protein
MLVRVIILLKEYFNIEMLGRRKREAPPPFEGAGETVSRRRTPEGGTSKPNCLNKE